MNETAVLSKTQKVIKSASGSIWRCDDCSIWWGKQLFDAPKTSFLFDIPESMAATLPWEEYRGWMLHGDPSICPECGQMTAWLVYSATGR